MIVALAAAVAALASTAAGTGPLRTAVVVSDSSPLSFERIHQSGATVVRINLAWDQVAPNGSRAPGDFRPTDPADPHYDWTEVDRQVELAVANGLQPLLTVIAAPLWAQKDEPHPTHLGPYPVNSWKPSPPNLASFAHAAATRYSGTFAGLPRVRYWEVWDEPNLSQYLSPQLENDQVVSPDTYRGLVNAFANEVHAVHEDNVVAAGSLSAFSFLTPYGRLGIAPMLFMRRLLCMSAGANPKPTCNKPVSFDAWSHHPWTSGGPTHHASEKDDASLGDLHRMHRLLNAAVRAGHVRSDGPVQFWITEFGWDTRPPDPHPEAAPIALQSRWVAEGLYRAWKEGISLFTWLVLWDRPYPASALQSGLYSLNGDDFRYAVPKPTFSAFRFPFVAYRHGRQVSVWGRTPYGRPGRVAVQQRSGSRWRWLGTFKAGRDGIFKGSVRYRPGPKSSRPARLVTRATSYRDLVVSASPTSYWPLDEKGGTTAEDTMKADNGTYAGNVKLGQRGAVPGGTAIGLDGKTGRVRLGRVANAHSIELWAKSTSLINGAAFSNRNGVHAYTFLGGNGGLAFSYDDYSIFAAPISNGRWHHVVYTYDSATSTGKVYVDGQLSSFAVYPRREGGADASIGYDASLRTYFKGQIDEVAVYPYVLSLDQVRSHYVASGRSIPPAIPSGVLRAVEQRSRIASLPFSLQIPRDRYVLPFGGGGPGFRRLSSR
ncbi:MAG TPA: LamG domain-containing protein [Gaiellaceae bacterium]